MQTIGFGFSRYDNPKTQAMPLWKKTHKPTTTSWTSSKLKISTSKEYHQEKQKTHGMGGNICK